MPLSYLPLLAEAPLFSGFTLPQITTLLHTLSPTTRHYAKHEILLHAGYKTNQIGVLLRGEIEAHKLTSLGHTFTVSRMTPGSVFGDVLSGSHTSSPVTVTACSACEVLYLPYPLIPGGSISQKHAQLYLRLQSNLISTVSNKYFALSHRVDLLLIKSLRQRISAYLFATASGSQHFTIPHTRASLAAYLGCERSALSRELSRMSHDGLLQTSRSQFYIPNLAALQTVP